MMTVERQLPRKNRIIRLVSPAATAPSRTTPLMAAFTNSDWSVSTLTLSSGGICWRSTVIIATSIPLAVLSALMALWATGQTLNIMTLGGLALAVGILADDATVTIENINWHLEHGKPVRDAVMDGARQITQPAFVSLLCICVAFVPMFSLQGVTNFLFVPMALAVVFAMIASFILSRTLVPTLALYLLKLHSEEHAALGNNMFARLQKRFED